MKNNIIYTIKLLVNIKESAVSRSKLRFATGIKISVLFVATFAILVTLTSFTYVKAYNNSTYNTRITFDKTKANPLVINKSKTEIVAGFSDATISDLNNNPNPENIKNFMQAIAPEYGVDWKFVYAIGYHESANYNSSLARNNNNYFGRKASSSGYASWATPEEAIRNQFVYLKTRYFERGLTTPASINRVYAEDMTWHYRVEAVMASL